MEVFLVQVLVFMAIVLLVLGIDTARRGTRVERPVTTNYKAPFFFRTLKNEFRRLGELAGGFIDQMFPMQARDLTECLVSAGLSQHVQIIEIRGAQVMLGLILLIAPAVFLFAMGLSFGAAIASGIFLGLVGFIYPPMWVKRTAIQRRERISKDLPFALDLLTVSMQAGQDFGAALRFLVKEAGGGPLIEEFRIMTQEIDLGRSRVEALKLMAQRIHVDEFMGVVTAVVQSAELGASMTSALKAQAEEMRRLRFHRAERKAARIPSLMTIPVVLFVLPSVFVIILTPIAIRVLGSIKGMG